MVHQSFSSLSNSRETNNEQDHVLITEYLTGTIPTANEIKVQEHSTIAVSPNDHRLYRSVHGEAVTDAYRRNIPSACRLIELRNGLRCMLVTNNLHEGRDDEDEERSDQEDTESVTGMSTHILVGTWCSSVFLAIQHPLPMWMKHFHNISWSERVNCACVEKDSDKEPVF